MTATEQAYRKGYRAGLDASRGVCTPVTKGNTTTCSVCGSDGIVKSWAEVRGWGGELVHMQAELWPYCPQCGAKLMEVLHDRD